MEQSTQISPNSAPKRKIKFYSLTPLDDVNKKASQAVKRPRQTHDKSKIEKKVNSLKLNSTNTLNYNDSDISVNYSDNSISGFLYECHPDLRKFIDNNEWYKITSTAGKVIITTRNRFRITIDNVSRVSKSVTIKDNKHNVIFNGIQKTHYKEVTA